MTGRGTREYLAGAIMTAAGLAVVYEARTFGIGTTARVGPGLYPLVLGVALSVIGVLIALAPRTADASPAADSHDAAEFGRPDWRGWSCIILGIVLFIGVGEHAGLGPATFACVFVSALGDRRATFLSSLVLGAGATVMAAVVFSWLLKFQLPFWRWD